MLIGELVSLAPVRETDLPALFGWINDRELVLRSAPYRPVHETDHRRWWQSVTADPTTVLFGIRLRQEDRLIGSCQLVGVDLRHRTAGLQIRIGDAEARGRGLGTEAVRLLLTHAFGDLDLHRVGLHVFASNAPAIVAYTKCGFAREGVLREAALIAGRREDIVLMGILRDDWARRG